MLDQATIDSVSQAIADTDIGHYLRQIRLVDGINTYRLEIDGFAEEFVDNDDMAAIDQAYARIAEVKRRKQAEAVVAALSVRSNGTVSASHDAAKPVRWQRRTPGKAGGTWNMSEDGWLDVPEEDIPGYRERGQEIRGLFDHPENTAPSAIDALQVIADLPTGATEDVMRGQEDAYRAVEALFSTPPHIVCTPREASPYGAPPQTEPDGQRLTAADFEVLEHALSRLPDEWQQEGGAILAKLNGMRAAGEGRG